MQITRANTCHFTVLSCKTVPLIHLRSPSTISLINGATLRKGTRKKRDVSGFFRRFRDIYRGNFSDEGKLEERNIYELRVKPAYDGRILKRVSRL